MNDAPNYYDPNKLNLQSMIANRTDFVLAASLLCAVLVQVIETNPSVLGTNAFAYRAAMLNATTNSDREVAAVNLTNVLRQRFPNVNDHSLSLVLSQLDGLWGIPPF